MTRYNDAMLTGSITKVASRVQAKPIRVFTRAFTNEDLQFYRTKKIRNNSKHEEKQMKTNLNTITILGMFYIFILMVNPGITGYFVTPSATSVNCLEN